MKVLIIGAARSGTQAAYLLASHHHAVTITDMKQIDAKRELEEAGVQVLDHGHPEFLKMENWDLIVKNPGIPLSCAVRAVFRREKGTDCQ